MIIYKCDLCDQAKACQQKEIDGKEYDICLDCWNCLEEKLKGKGRPNKDRERVILPPVRVGKEGEDEKPHPGEPPKVWYRSPRPLGILCAIVPWCLL